MYRTRFSFTITRFVTYDNPGPLKAFCDVVFGQHLLIKGIRVIEGRHGPFVSMPRQQNRLGKWYDSVVPLTKETKEELGRIVLEAFHASLSASNAKKEDTSCNTVMS